MSDVQAHWNIQQLREPEPSAALDVAVLPPWLASEAVSPLCQIAKHASCVGRSHCSHEYCERIHSCGCACHKTTT